MLDAVLRSPLAFFERNPVGRVLNRFCKDQAALDDELPALLFDVARCLATVACSLIVVAAALPLILPVLVPSVALFLWEEKHYVRTSQPIKRFDAITRSPVYAQFSTTLLGLTTVRAFQAHDIFLHTFLDKLDCNARAQFALLTAQRWLGVRLDLVAAINVTVTGVFAVLWKDRWPPQAAGLALVYVMMLTALLQWTVRQRAEADNMMTSTERVLAYVQLPSEAARQGPTPLPASWPQSGHVVFSDVSLRYRDDTPLVLRGLSFEVRAGEKVGVCGRTGAGKSSLFVALFRLVELSQGQVLVDGVDCASVGLQQLRTRLAVIPQDPVLFSGTLRYNLDPFNERTDSEMVAALEAVELGAKLRFICHRHAPSTVLILNLM